jgi:hypothetical protein
MGNLCFTERSLQFSKFMHKSLGSLFSFSPLFLFSLASPSFLLPLAAASPSLLPPTLSPRPLLFLLHGRLGWRGSCGSCWLGRSGASAEQPRRRKRGRLQAVRAMGAWLGRAQGDGRAGAARPRARGRRAGAAAAGGRGSGVSGAGVRHGRVSAARADTGMTARCGKRAGGALQQEQAQARAGAVAARARELAAV